MRKALILFFLTLILGIGSNAQKSEQKVFQGFTVRAIAGAGGLRDFKGKEIQNKKVDLETNFFIDLDYITRKTRHSLMYNINQSNVSMLNAVILPHEFEPYLIYSKSLRNGGDYLALGLEKSVFSLEKKKTNLKIVLFLELGTFFHKESSFSFGVLLSVRNEIWRKRS